MASQERRRLNRVARFLAKSASKFRKSGHAVIVTVRLEKRFPFWKFQLKTESCSEREKFSHCVFRERFSLKAAEEGLTRVTRRKTLAFQE